MASLTVVKAIKNVHVNSILLVKIGKFYRVYGKDSYILAYIFGYQLKDIESVKSCGFPIEAVNKVISKLEQKKINYLIVDRRNNYDLDGITDYKNLNAYLQVYEKAKEYVQAKSRVEAIYDYMMHHINNKKLIQQVEKVIKDEG